MNFRTLSLSVLLLVLAAAGSADAQKIELASMMCKKFSMLAKDTQWTVTSWLAGYYTDVGLIAMRLGVTTSEVSAQLRAFGIPRRPACNRGRRTSDVELTKAVLEDLFITRRLTIREMAARLNSPIGTIFSELRRLGIVERDPQLR